LVVHRSLPAPAPPVDSLLTFIAVIPRISNDGLTTTSYNVSGGADGNPGGIGTDAAGSVWFANRSINRIQQVVGTGAPTVTPLSRGVATGTLATMP
jgi:hypothetical protein